MQYNTKEIQIYKTKVKINHWYSEGKGYMAFNLYDCNRKEVLPFYFIVKGNRPFEDYQKDFHLGIELALSENDYPKSGYPVFSVLREAAAIAGFLVSFNLEKINP